MLCAAGQVPLISQRRGRILDHRHGMADQIQRAQQQLLRRSGLHLGLSMRNRRHRGLCMRSRLHLGLSMRSRLHRGLCMRNRLHRGLIRQSGLHRHLHLGLNRQSGLHLGLNRQMKLQLLTRYCSNPNLVCRHLTCLTDAVWGELYSWGSWVE
jgi:hypothetical protein